MKVYIGSDHNGFNLKSVLIRYLKLSGYNVIDDGNEKLSHEDDYPVFAARVVKDILSDSNKNTKGILICGSGQGMCIAANRYKGIRACLGYDLDSVRSARNDDDCNILCLPAKYIEEGTANLIVETFLNTKFAKAPRYIRRIREIDNI